MPKKLSFIGIGRTTDPERKATTGTEIIGTGVELLRGVGGVVKVFNSRFRNYAAPGWPDCVWIFRDTVFLIEVKGKGDKFRENQTRFAESISDHCGLHVRYRVVNSVDGFRSIAREGADIT